MTYSETPLVFECEGDRLIGIVAQPTGQPCEVGVLILVGGPQYRAGSHRQFTLLARDLASANIASLRFDYRGMGDSEGAPRTFEAIDSDIRIAIDTLLETIPTLRSMIVWGLCDAASALLMYAHSDSRIRGMVLLNPWVHTEDALARVRLKHYYLKRLMQRTLWLKLLSGGVQLHRSTRDLIHSVLAVLRTAHHSPKDHDSSNDSMLSDTNQLPGIVSTKLRSPVFIDRMLKGLQLFQFEILFILSGKDLVASEFLDLIDQDRSWRNACRGSKCCSRKLMSMANHTFSSQHWRAEVSSETIKFVKICHARLSNGGIK